MTTEKRHLCAVALVVTIAIAHPAAQGHTDLKRVRTESSFLQAVVSTAFDRSVLFQSLIDRIERSDVIAHLTCAQFSSETLAGRTVLVAAKAEVRYLRVEVRCQQLMPPLVGIVAHELQHDVEIASAPSVIDDQSIAALFRTIGFQSRGAFWGGQFETTAAQDVGDRVQSEVFRRPAPILIDASVERPARARN